MLLLLGLLAIMLTTYLLNSHFSNIANRKVYYFASVFLTIVIALILFKILKSFFVISIPALLLLYLLLPKRRKK
jgi:hypothetical protein